MSISLKALSGVTKKLAASGAKFNAAMQEHLLNIITFVNDPQYNGETGATTGNGNVSPATELVDAITRKVDRDAIISWFQKHGGMKYQAATKATDKKAAQPARFKRETKDFTYDLETAKTDMWYADKVANAKSDVRTTKFDAPAKLKTFIQSFHTAQNGSHVDGDNMPAGLLEALNELYIRYSEEKVSAIEVKSPTADNTDKPTPAPVKAVAS